MAPLRGYFLGPPSREFFNIFLARELAMRIIEKYPWTIKMEAK